MKQAGTILKQGITYDKKFQQNLDNTDVYRHLCPVPVTTQETDDVTELKIESSNQKNDHYV